VTSLETLQQKLEEVQATPNPETKRGGEVLVVLPAYNEEENIGALLQRIDEDLSEDRLPYRVLVVDDGSADRTPQILETCATQYPLHVRRHERNLGLGATIRDGLLQASEMAGPRDIVITMDADETHTPGLVQRMVRMIREGHDVVIASRYQPQARVVGLSFGRRAISYGASLLMRVVFPTPGVRDYTCGFRAYRATVLTSAIEQYGDAFLNQDGFQCMVDILLKLRRMPVIFGEVPMILRYDRKKGASKMRLARTAYRTLRLMLRRRLGLSA
jgi:dolichol-phosphate mannosyltransferase